MNLIVETNTTAEGFDVKRAKYCGRIKDEDGKKVGGMLFQSPSGDLNKMLTYQLPYLSKESVYKTIQEICNGEYSYIDNGHEATISSIDYSNSDPSCVVCGSELTSDGTCTNPGCMTRKRTLAEDVIQ